MQIAMDQSSFGVSQLPVMRLYYTTSVSIIRIAYFYMLKYLSKYRPESVVCEISVRAFDPHSGRAIFLALMQTLFLTLLSCNNILN